MIASIGSLLKGLTVGAGVMYFCDPQRGRRRRAAVTDRLTAETHELETLWVKGVRDLQNRASGMSAGARRMLETGSTEDRVLTARVRSALGHLITDARAVTVETSDGHVTLRGTVRPGEPERLIPAVERVPGVRHVQSGLTVSGLPAIEGHPPASELAPGPRLLLTAGGALLLLNGLARKGLGSTIVGAAGCGMLVRGLSDRPGGLTGLVRSRRGIDLHKSIYINAPIEKVFDFISDVEQSKRFLPNVSRVEELGDGRTRWTLATAFGELTFEERTIATEDNHRLVWESGTGSPVPYAGETLFESQGEGTRVHVRLTYRPPGGVFGHAAAALLGVDPRTQLDGSLNRIKLYLEEGTLPRGVSASTVKGHG